MKKNFKVDFMGNYSSPHNSKLKVILVLFKIESSLFI